MSTITVGNTAALSSALIQAHSGDTIRLLAGEYDGLAIKNLDFPTGVTITSADPLHQAVLTGFSMTNVTGLTVSNVDMNANGVAGYFDFTVRNSTGIHFDHVNVHGSLDGNAANDANGISFAGSSNISVTNSTFQQLGRAMATSTSSNVQLTGNTVHDMRTDGFDFAQVDHVTVSGNNFTSFHPVTGDHPDAIQFWTTGTTAPSHDIVISNNVVTLGDGASTQGIFMRDLDGKLPFQNVTISGNLLDGTGYSGIRVIYGQGLTITGNMLTTNVGSANQTFMLVQNADNVTSHDNTAVSIGFSNVTHLTESGDQLNGVMSDNGNTVLSNWLHAHGQDALLPNLQAAVSQAAMATLGPVNLSTVSTSSQQASQAVQGAQVMSSTATSLKLGGSLNTDAVGNDLNDSITGNSAANHLYGGAGNDTLDGGGGNDTLVGGAGDDTFMVPNGSTVVVEEAGGGNDTVIAKGDYTLPANVENLVINSTGTNSWDGTGNELNNKITGNGGANILDGGAGNDTLDGGAGNDKLVGGAGDDRLTGGAGVDMFRFALHSGHDVITDFGAGGQKDAIDISAYKSAGLTPTLHDVGNDLVISFTSGDSITLLGVHAHDLVATTTGWVF